VRSRTQASRWQGRALAVATAMMLCAITFAPTSAGAASGGTATPGSDVPTGGKAKLDGGEAIAPAGAPARVQRAIKFANRIRKKRYKWGGGHGGWEIDKGYDCSGAVSYALHGGRMLDSPMPSGPLSRWGKKGKGDWITVYANGGHAYAVIAGLRWDTSGGPGPRWHKDMRSSGGFKKRHFKKY
jgi:cell wall-associated NlpC family hydrolase